MTVSLAADAGAKGPSGRPGTALAEWRRRLMARRPRDDDGTLRPTVTAEVTAARPRDIPTRGHDARVSRGHKWAPVTQLALKSAPFFKNKKI